MKNIIKQIIKWIKGLFSNNVINREIEKTDSNIDPYKYKKGLRNANSSYAKTKGFTVNKAKLQIKKRIILSPYKQAVLRFVDLKAKNKIDIKSYRNKWGVPFYDIKKI